MYDIALVGSGGFLGGAIRRTLAREGHRVACFTRQDPLVAGGRVAPAAAAADVVIEAAGGVSPTVAAQQPEVAAAELTEFRDAMRALSDASRPPRVVLLSSGGTAYDGSVPPPYRETAPLQPANAYGEFKLAQERIAREAGLPGTALRISNAYGPGQLGVRGQGVLAIWIRAVLAGDPVRLYGRSSIARDYVYVDDVAEAVRRVVETPRLPEAVNVGSGHPTTLDELAARMMDVVGADRMRVERLPSRGVDAESTWLDVSLAREVLGWTAAVPLEEGIARTWQWIAGS